MLRHISQQQFIKNLHTRRLEDVSIINNIETVLKEHREYVFRQPARGDSVILLLSGGLDSVTCWGILMKEFGLHVYPISFDRGEKKAKKEKAVTDYFSEWYQTRFPDLFHEVKRLALNVQDITLRVETAQNQLHPELLLEKIIETDQYKHLNVSLGSFLLFPVYAKMYADYIYMTQNIKVRTIFCAVTPSDGLVVAHQTFTALRSIMHHLCITTGDYSWQFASPIFEKEIGMYMEKSELITWAEKHHIPIERTWTCSFASRYQCGGSDCRSCLARRSAFEEAGVRDKTIYRSIYQQSFIKRMKHLLRQLYSGLTG